MYTLVFYVPADAAESVKDAVFKAGAGRLGPYENCCWESSGTGQFRPLPGSSPAIGRTNRLEKVEELRVEMICQSRFIKEVLKALADSHPYEEPAYAVFHMEEPSFE